eukprot:267643-Rhodomonas_salina.1
MCVSVGPFVCDAALSQCPGRAGGAARGVCVGAHEREAPDRQHQLRRRARVPSAHHHQQGAAARAGRPHPTGQQRLAVMMCCERQLSAAVGIPRSTASRAVSHHCHIAWHRIITSFEELCLVSRHVWGCSRCLELCEDGVLGLGAACCCCLRVASVVCFVDLHELRQGCQGCECLHLWTWKSNGAACAG